MSSRGDGGEDSRARLFQAWNMALQTAYGSLMEEFPAWLKWKVFDVLLALAVALLVRRFPSLGFLPELLTTGDLVQ